MGRMGTRTYMKADERKKGDNVSIVIVEQGRKNVLKNLYSI